jgi:hypothetical protein
METGVKQDTMAKPSKMQLKYGLAFIRKTKKEGNCRKYCQQKIN